MLVEYTGFDSSILYDCGECTEETEGITCKTCVSAADTACNTPVAAGADFNCLNYEVKNGTFVATETATVCKRKDGTAIACNMLVFIIIRTSPFQIISLTMFDFH